MKIVEREWDGKTLKLVIEVPRVVVAVSQAVLAARAVEEREQKIEDLVLEEFDKTLFGETKEVIDVSGRSE